MKSDHYGCVRPAQKLGARRLKESDFQVGSHLEKLICIFVWYKKMPSTVPKVIFSPHHYQQYQTTEQ